MFPIILGPNQSSLNPATFKQELLEICERHRSEGRAMAFAFIVFDFRDFAINKFLHDEDYWTTLDHLSGKYLTVFYIDSQDQRFKEIQEQKRDEQMREMARYGTSGMIFQMVPVSLKPPTFEKTDEFLMKKLGVTSYVKRPFVVFFQAEGDYIVDSFALGLKQEKLEDSFLELKRHIQYAVEALEGITAEDVNPSVL